MKGWINFHPFSYIIPYSKPIIIQYNLHITLYKNNIEYTILIDKHNTNEGELLMKRLNFIKLLVHGSMVTKVVSGVVAIALLAGGISIYKYYSNRMHANTITLASGKVVPGIVPYSPSTGVIGVPVTEELKPSKEESKDMVVGTVDTVIGIATAEIVIKDIDSKNNATDVVVVPPSPTPTPIPVATKAPVVAVATQKPVAVATPAVVAVIVSQATVAPAVNYNQVTEIPSMHEQNYNAMIQGYITDRTIGKLNSITITGSIKDLMHQTLVNITNSRLNVEDARAVWVGKYVGNMYKVKSLNYYSINIKSNNGDLTESEFVEKVKLTGLTDYKATSSLRYDEYAVVQYLNSRETDSCARIVIELENK